MKIVAYNGSPRLEGNTHIIIQKMFEVFNANGIETIEINIAHDQVKGCCACGRCKRVNDNTCALTDDKFNEYYNHTIDADGVILASPTYFADITGQMKCFIDRFASVGRNNKTLQYKLGASFVIGRRDGMFHAYSTLNAVFGSAEMFSAGSNYWNMAIGGEIGAVLNDTEGINTATTLANNMITALKNIR